MALATELMTEPSVAVTVDLQADPNAKNGLAWTHAAGGERDLRAGLLAKIAIVTASRRPAALLFPMLGR